MATITNISDWVVSGRRLHGAGIDVGTLIIYPIGTGGVASQYAQDLVASPDWLTAVYPGATVSGVLFSDNGPEPPPLPPSPRWVGLLHCCGVNRIHPPLVKYYKHNKETCGT